MRNVDKTGVDSGTDAQRLTGNSPRCSSIPIGQTEIDRILVCVKRPPMTDSRLQFPAKPATSHYMSPSTDATCGGNSRSETGYEHLDHANQRAGIDYSWLYPDKCRNHGRIRSPTRKTCGPAAGSNMAVQGNTRPTAHSWHLVIP